MIKNNITFVEMKNCIDMAVDLCFEDGIYQPAMKDFAVWVSLATYFTDSIKEDMKLEEQYEVVCDEHLREALMNVSQVDSIYSAMLEAIDIKVRKEIRKTRWDKIIDAVAEALSDPEIAKMINGFIEEIGMVEDGEER